MILDGKAIAAKVRAEVAVAAAGAAGQRASRRALAVVLVGDDPASAVYVRSKTKAAREAGVEPRDHKLPASTTQAELMAADRRARPRSRPSTASSSSCRCRRTWTATPVIRAIDPAKDVDGLHPTVLGLPRAGPPGRAAVHAEGLHAPAARGRARS